ncbi:hypothetical protein G6F65_021178 [Rhizopus arrhizus]|nr:hypothetical protein G6F65_021178 [Rhizopus arrhizus]
MQVQRHRDRHVGRLLAQALQQVAFAVIGAFDRHGAVQIQQDRAAPSRAGHDRIAKRAIGGRIHPAAGIGGGRYRRDQRRPVRLREVDESGHSRAFALVVLVGLRAKSGAVVAERGQRRGHGRERIGLVVQAGDHDFHCFPLCWPALSRFAPAPGASGPGQSFPWPRWPR